MRARSESSSRGYPLVTTSGSKFGSVLQCSIAYNKYGGYCVPLSSSHRPAAKKVLSGDIWEPKTIEFLTSRCGAGDIVHAGTFFGDFLPALSKALAQGSRVWAFEPNPENYRCAFMTTYINGLQNVELINAGLGECRGSLRMIVSDTDGISLGGASRIVREADEDRIEGSITVEVVTVDEVIPSDRKISIIQLDVEGFEKPALAGALKSIRRCKPILILESLPDEDWLSTNLLQLGYSIAGKAHDNTILICEESPGDAT
jgi:FkbM family methyltransferase